MPPAVGHYRPNLSNPFNNFPQSHALHQPSHYQPQASNYQSQHFGGHGQFPSTGQNGHLNVFGGSGLTNSAIPGNFGAGGLSGAGGTGLASQEAQMRFAHGAAMQQQQQAHENGGMRSVGVTRIREVWAGNLHAEMETIRTLIEKYPYVSMDTEFPGVVARPIGNFTTKADYHYQCLRANVDILKLIQLGITLWSTDGDVPAVNPEAPIGRSPYTNNLMPCPCTWTFNFKFSLDEDMASEESIVMLKKAGVNFEKSAEMGIDPAQFGSLLITSGLVTDNTVTWLSFHSGYDFAYLVKIMLPKAMPEGEQEFLDLVRLWFPKIYDIKYLFRHAQKLANRGILNPHATNIINALGQKSGLQDLADELGCQREGAAHTAGSDAWLTGLVFWSLRQKIFEGQLPEGVLGMIWGLSGVGPPASAANQAAGLASAAIAAGQQTPSTNGASLYTGITPPSYKSDVSVTPQTTQPGMTSTPGPHGMSYGQLTAGGAFQNFQYGAR